MTKKTLALIAFLLALMSCVFAFADIASDANSPTEYTSGDYTYVLLDNNNAEITKYSGNAETIEIPSHLDGYAVKSIGDEAFYSCSGLASVDLPNGLLSIGNLSFAYCSNSLNSL